MVLLDEPLYLRTGGVVEFEFNSDPPYGDTSEYGEVTVKMLIVPIRLFQLNQ